MHLTEDRAEVVGKISERLARLSVRAACENDKSIAQTLSACGALSIVRRTRSHLALTRWQ